ncbi:integrase/recombinase xerD homolog isoform X3 [Dysidea avara]|uniref:integrase/recombinase xerD homolog isoform X3 n=1 Tax=Dysidea avara TaxID=196820 RepID=UPI00332964D3
MENEMFDKLMAELQQTCREMDEKITSSMAEVKREVSYAQERTAKDFSQKLNRTTYQFRKKGNEKQYTFNSGVEEAIASAQQELERMASSVDDGGKESLRKAADHLEEGLPREGTWKLLDELHDPVLKDLASRLPNTILHSRASSTVKKYLGAYRRWKSWAVSHRLPPFPAKPQHFVLYLQHLGETIKSKSAVEEACNALSWVHSSSGFAAPSSHPFVRATLEGLQRELAKPIVKKEPVTVEMLEAMVKDAESSGTLSDLRLVTACLLSFAGFLRSSELVELRPCDCSATTQMLKVNIVKSKNDQLRHGSELLIARTNSSTCPVAMLEQYMARTGMRWGDDCYLFRAIQRTKNGETLRQSGHISYSCVMDLFKKKMSKLGFEAPEFGLHSLRSGGATTAANAGVPDRLFKRHGRWRSENAKDGYIKDSVEKRLQVSKKLGLYLLSYSLLCSSKCVISYSQPACGGTNLRW